MCNLLIMLAIACVLAGCANVVLPTCDGKDRRPINDVARAEVVHPSCGAAA